MTNTKKLEAIASQVRRDIMRMVTVCNSGHPGGSLGAADILTALYFEIMDIDPANFSMNGKGEDVYYQSNGHVSPLFYSVISRRGYFPIQEMGTFRILGSRLQGHPTPAKGLPGVRVASGSLGQGLSCAIGHALAKKLDGDDHKVFVMMGDGELQEGQIWEAAAFATGRKVDNIIGIVDYNGQQIDGSIEHVMPQGDGSLRAKWESFGWRVLEVDGNNMEEVVKTLQYAKDNATGKGHPVVILAHTVMGKGVDFMEGTHEWHGKVPSADQIKIAMEQLKETLGDY